MLQSPFYYAVHLCNRMVFEKWHSGSKKEIKTRTKDNIIRNGRLALPRNT